MYHMDFPAFSLYLRFDHLIICSIFTYNEVLRKGKSRASGVPFNFLRFQIFGHDLCVLIGIAPSTSSALGTALSLLVFLHAYSAWSGTRFGAWAPIALPS